MFWLKKAPPQNGDAEERKKYDIFTDDTSKTPRNIAIVLAILFHIILIFVVLPQTPVKIFDQRDVIVLRNISPPPPGIAKKDKGSLDKPKTPARTAAPKKEKLVPFPDPTPDDPEPLITPTPEIAAPIINEIADQYEIGEIVGPVGPTGDEGKGKTTLGQGEDQGGEGIYKIGDSGVIPPVILQQSKPKYTENARRNRVQGNVFLTAVIGKDGRVSDIRIVQSLDPELDESAIKTIAIQWQFKPATLNGLPVPFRVNIIIEFNLF